MNTPKLPDIPAFCDICCMYPAENIVPDRFSIDDWTAEVYCPLCLDDFLSQFPVYFKELQNRELTGKYALKRSSPHRNT
jgi:hypothetical protein